MSQSLNYEKALTCMKDVITLMRYHGAEMQPKERHWWAETETSLWRFTNSKIKMEKSIKDVPFKSQSRGKISCHHSVCCTSLVKILDAW